MGADLRRFLEVCHDGPAQLEPWLHELLPVFGLAAAPEAGLSLSLYWSSDLGRSSVVGHVGRAVGLSSYADAALRAGVANGYIAGIHRAFRVATVREVFGISAPELARAVDVAIPRDCSAMTDQQGLRAASGDWLAVASMPVWAGEPAPRRRHLLRLQRHWASAASLRSSAVDLADSEAIFDRQGRLLHRSGGGLPLAAERVARAFANDLGQSEDEATEQVWEQLWEGGYSVARVVDQDGKRLVVLKRTKGRLRLTRAEVRVVRLALAGNALKNIASELGTTVSTASTQLQSALHKLGLTDRVQLLRLFSARPDRAGK